MNRVDERYGVLKLERTIVDSALWFSGAFLGYSLLRSGCIAKFGQCGFGIFWGANTT